MNTPTLEGICVLVDGGCRNNNKPVTERSMYGSMTVFYNGKQVTSTLPCGGTAVIHKFVDWEHCQNVSNNQAELETLYAGLLYIDALRERMDDDEREFGKVTVLVVSDSEFALGIASGTMKLNKKSHQDLHNAAERIHTIMRQLDVIFQHVSNLWVKEILGH